MNHLLVNKLFRIFIFTVLACVIRSPKAQTQCAACAGDDQKMVVQLRGAGYMAGSAIARISWGNNVVEKPMVSSTAAIVWNPSTGEYEPTGFQCVQWDADITVNTFLNEAIKIEYIYDANNQSPGYTEFGVSEEGPNPVTVWTQPSSPCLKFWFDLNDGNWVPASDFFLYTDTIRLKGTMGTGGSGSNLGDGRALKAGGGMPIPNTSCLTDAPPVGDVCPQEGLMAAAFDSSRQTDSASTKKGGLSAAKSHLENLVKNGKVSRPAIGKQARRSGMRLAQPKLNILNVNTNVAFPASGKKTQTSQPAGNKVSNLVTAQSLVGSNGVSITDPIGRLRWELSLGSGGRTHDLGALIYQANVLDATAYSPARLRLAQGSDVAQQVTDGNGSLRQIIVSDQLVDILTNSTGFGLTVYPAGQFGSFDTNTGRFPITGTASLSWQVANPDATPLGKVRFTKTQGANTEVHEAQWQGTAGSSGTMTILRFGAKWKDQTEYSLNSTQRIETISYFKNNILQRKVREVYQEFYNWGGPGDIYEALVQKTDDPDGRALTTTYQYWDSTSQPGNLAYQIIYPDGYTERTPNRVSGSGLYPVVTAGDPVRKQESYKDNDAGSVNGTTFEKTFTVIDPQFLKEETVTIKNNTQVGYRRRFHDFTIPGVWGKITYDADGAGAFAYSEEWLNIDKRQTILSIDRNGIMRSFRRGFGYWNPATGTLDESETAGTAQAFSTTIIQGTLDAPNGISNKTTINLTVDDQFGNTVLEEVYVSNGTDQISPDRLIDRKVHTYTDGRLTATRANGRLTHRASFSPAGLMEWEENETGRRTEFAYDEMDRINEMIVRGRGGDSDRITSFDYDAGGRRIAEVTIAGALTNQTRWVYNLAGELTQLIGPDGLTNTITSSFASGYRVMTETLPTQATRVTSFFKDRQPRSVTGTAVEDEFYSPAILQWTTGAYREGVSVYRDSAMTQLKGASQINWLGNEVVNQTPLFKGTGLRDRATTYDAAVDINSYVITHTRPIAVTETGRATQVFNYDNLGRLAAQGFDLNANSALDAASLEPITTFSRQFVSTNGVWQDVSEVQRYLEDNSTNVTLAQRTLVLVPASLSTNIVSSNIVERPGGGRVITTMDLNGAGELTTTVNDSELGRVNTQVQRDGLLRSELRPGITSPKTYNYTALGQLAVVIDPVTGSVTNTYDTETHRLVAVTDSLSRTVGYDYFPADSPNAGRLKGAQDAAGKWTYFDYNARGQVFHQWGVNTFPVERRYDEVGRMTNLVTFRTRGNEVNWSSATWPNPPAGDATTWIYDDPSGLLERKISADAGAGAKTVIYTYDSANFPDTKVNGRAQTIDYNYNSLGRLTATAYSDGTPSSTMTYDRAGRLRTVSDASGTRTLDWTERDQPGDESYTSGILAGISVTRGYDAAARLSTLGVAVGGIPQTRERFSYDPISRVDYIADETPDGLTELNRFDYTFKPNTPFIQSVEFLHGATTVMTNRYNRDNIGRLTGVNSTLAAGASISGVDYQLDALDRRFRADQADGTHWEYGYNDRSEVTSGKKKLASGAFAGGSQFEYDFDDIGNRTASRSGGDAAGGNLRESVYTPNALNETVSRSVPASEWLTGDAPASLVLQAIVDGRVSALERQEGGRFFGEAQANNEAGAVFMRTVVAGKTNGALNDVKLGHQFIPRTPENFAYDADGNLTQDGRWVYAWDAESRLVSMTARSDIPDAAKSKLEFVYDFSGRRVQKTVYSWNGAGYTAQSTNRFAYDGWTVLAVFDPQSTVLQSFMWGLDLSGTTSQAGGVGGLLQASFYGSSKTNCYASYDGNGNILALVDANSSTAVARYEYGPFGELTRETGLLAAINPFRFSTKFRDHETGLIYYGARYLNVSTGKWLGRDPMGEDGGYNLHCFVGNNGINMFDPFGNEGFMSDWIGGMGSSLYNLGDRVINGVQQGMLLTSDMIGSTVAWGYDAVTGQNVQGYYEGYSDVYQNYYENAHLYDPDKLRADLAQNGLESVANVATLGTLGVASAIMSGDENNVQDAFLNMALLNFAVKGQNLSQALSAGPNAEVQTLMNLAAQGKLAQLVAALKPTGGLAELNAVINAAKAGSIDKLRAFLCRARLQPKDVFNGKGKAQATGPAEEGGQIGDYGKHFPKKAIAPVDKFSKYIFKEGASHGKDKPFKSLGYSAEDSIKLAKLWEKQAAAKFQKGDYTLGKLDEYGQRINIEIEVPGVGSAAGESSFMTSGWMIKPDGTITLNTPFSGFSK